MQRLATLAVVAALMLADMMGHSVATALYTMHLSQLWEQRSQNFLKDPLSPPQRAHGWQSSASSVSRGGGTR